MQLFISIFHNVILPFTDSLIQHVIQYCTNSISLATCW